MAKAHITRPNFAWTMTSCCQRRTRTYRHRHGSPLSFLRPCLKSAGNSEEFFRREHSLDTNRRSLILDMYMQVKGGATDSLDLSGTGSCAAFNFRRTARAVARLYDLGLEPSGLRATQFAILTAIAKFQPVSISRIGEILVLDQTTLTRS